MSRTEDHVLRGGAGWELACVTPTGQPRSLRVVAKTIALLAVLSCLGPGASNRCVVVRGRRGGELE